MGDSIRHQSVSPRPSQELKSTPLARTPSTSMRLAQNSSPSHAHRQSYHEQLRGFPPSPRANRHISLSQSQLQELLNNPPITGPSDPKFTGRDWQHIQVGELTDPKNLHFVELDTGIEAATNLLIDSSATVLLIRENAIQQSVVATFDYRDLLQYLLFATGQLHPDEEHLALFQALAKKAQQGQKVPLRDAKAVGPGEPFVTIPHTANLTKAVEVFGGGVHRVIVVEEGSDRVFGILSQLTLVKFLWENGQSFPIIDRLYPQTLQDLGIGSQHVISVNGDLPLNTALKLMNNEGVSSVAVVDNQNNVIGNISNVDVKLLTKSSAAPLLENTCTHFVTVILSTRGMNDGKDSFPVFYVSPHSTLAHTVAKLVATTAHRMWLTTPESPSLSQPSTPSAFTLSHPAPAQPPGLTGAAPQSLPQHPSLSTSTSNSISSSAMPGAAMSGHLSGVVSLTDILNLYARASGLHPEDPFERRRQRRRSSSSSFLSVRGSLDSARSSSVDIRERR